MTFNPFFRRLFRPLLRAMLGLVGLAGLLGIVSCDGGSGYQRKGASWRYDGTVFLPADPASFRPLDGLFGRDAERGYYRGSAVEGSHGASFEVLSEHEGRDRLAVYFCDAFRKAQEYWSVQYLRVVRIRDADPATYRVLGHGYARDQRRVYDAGVPFPVRDVASFEPLDRRFARDAQRGYFEHIEIPDSHGPSFALVDAQDNAYARDRVRVYHGHTEINQPNRGPHPVLRSLRGADVVAFRVLGRGYATDTRHVWYDGELLAKADAATFAVMDDYTGEIDARDGQQAWQRGKVSVAAAR